MNMKVECIDDLCNEPYQAILNRDLNGVSAPNPHSDCSVGIKCLSSHQRQTLIIGDQHFFICLCMISYCQHNTVWRPQMSISYTHKSGRPKLSSPPREVVFSFSLFSPYAFYVSLSVSGFEDSARGCDGSLSNFSREPQCFQYADVLHSLSLL